MHMWSQGVMLDAGLLCGHLLQHSLGSLAQMEMRVCVPGLAPSAEEGEASPSLPDSPLHASSRYQPEAAYKPRPPPFCGSQVPVPASVGQPLLCTPCWTGPG